jgi:hypothetical protein
MRRCELNSSGPGWNFVADFCEYSDEYLGSVKCREFSEKLSKFYFFRKAFIFEAN